VQAALLSRSQRKENIAIWVQKIKTNPIPKRHRSRNCGRSSDQRAAARAAGRAADKLG
jgi:hypothetical protein